MIGSGLSGSQSWGIPAGFDSQGFLTAAKTNFVTLQAAWDKSDIPALRAMMTDDMLGEIRAQLAEREAHTGGPVNQTDVVMIDASLLGIEDLGDDYMASVEFSGMIREDPVGRSAPVPRSLEHDQTQVRHQRLAGGRVCRPCNRSRETPHRRPWAPANAGIIGGMATLSPFHLVERFLARQVLTRVPPPAVGGRAKCSGASCCCSTMC